LFSNLPPFIPLPCKGGGNSFERGASPLLDTLIRQSKSFKRYLVSLLLTWLFSKGIKRDISPFKKISSLSLYEGERDKGWGIGKLISKSSWIFVSDLTPLIPLSLSRRGGNSFRRGALAPLRHLTFSKLGTNF